MNLGSIKRTYSEKVLSINSIDWEITYHGRMWNERFNAYTHTFDVTIEGQHFQFFKGLGHTRKDGKASINIEEVLNSLLSDSNIAQASFSDFCSDFGYETDSRKALKLYLDCQAVESKMRKALKGQYAAVKEEVETLEL